MDMRYDMNKRYNEISLNYIFCLKLFYNGINKMMSRLLFVDQWVYWVFLFFAK